MALPARVAPGIANVVFPPGKIPALATLLDCRTDGVPPEVLSVTMQAGLVVVDEPTFVQVTLAGTVPADTEFCQNTPPPTFVEFITANCVQGAVGTELGVAFVLAIASKAKSFAAVATPL